MNYRLKYESALILEHAAIKEHWQVELFFKAIKQNLKLKTFVGTSKKTILTQIWISMCIYLLVAYLKYMSKPLGPYSDCCEYCR